MVPHLANWEVAAYLSTHLLAPAAALYEPRESRLRMRIAKQARQGWSDKILLVSSAEPMAMRTFARKLRDGHNLWIMIDEEKQGRQLPLAVQYGVDIIPLCVERRGAVAFTVTVGERLRVAPGGDPRAQAEQLAQQMDQQFDTWVRQNPLDWYWLSALNLDKKFPQ